MATPTIKITGIDDILNSLNDKNVRKGVRSGLNKLGTVIKKTVQDATANEYNIKKSTIKAASRRTQRARVSNLTWSLFVEGNRIPLIEFKARQKGVSFTRNEIRRTRKDKQIGPVTVQVRKSGSRKDITGTPGAFIAKMPSGRVGVFRRTRRGGRLPIRQLYTVAVPEMIGSTKIQKFQDEAFNRKSEGLILDAVFQVLEK